MLPSPRTEPSRRPFARRYWLLLLTTLLPPAGLRAQETREPGPLAPGAVTSDWTRFLGPENNCTSPETQLLKDWPADGGPEVVWEMPTGDGYATPAIKGERLVYFHRLGDEDVVECRHPETGKLAWEFRYPTDYRDEYGYSSGPRCPPLIEGDCVYTYGAQGWLHCLQLATGKVVWKRHLFGEFGLSQNFFGVGDTPLVEGDFIIVNLGVPKGPGVLALNKHTGEQVWGAGDHWTPGYSSPIAATVHKKRRVFVFSGGKSEPPVGGLLAVDPKTGKELFRFPWRSRSYESVNAACPVVVDDKVFISASYQTGGVLLQLLPEGGYRELWQTSELGTHWATPVYKDGYLYGFDGRHEPEARLVCVEFDSGKLMWDQVITWQESVVIEGSKRTGLMAPGRASLLSVDGHFLCLGERGHLLWLDLSPEGAEVINHTWLFKARHTWGMPVLSRGLLYVNQNAVDLNGNPPRLICYDLRAAVKD